MDKVVVKFFESVLSVNEVGGRSVLEVGSKDVNGSIRPVIALMRPRKYVGVDMEPGKGVDEVCLAENLVKRFGPRSWDIVVCTEMLEHVKDWGLAVSNMKQVVKENGILVLTTRSPGFPRHGHPDDHWRFTTDHVKAIFADMDIKVIAVDFESPGIFVKAFKRRAFTEIDYAKISPEPAPK